MADLHRSDAVERVAPGVFRLRTLVVNTYFVVDPGAERPTWTLIDTGLIGYTNFIRRQAERLFGAGAHPAAILLTHGNFDHVGGLPTLADVWQAPVYVHPLELPYVTGTKAYAPPKPLNGGAMAWMSPLLPRGPIDLGDRVHMLPEGGDVPTLSQWRWMPTPGHTAGHVAFVRDCDRTLISGDAVVTTRQEYAIDVMTQRPAVWRPPAYFTTDWDAAWASVRVLADYEPEVLATGHGHALRGAEMRAALHHLADHFPDMIPNENRNWVPWAAAAGAATAAGVAIAMRRRAARART
jgi:glyoxylase-like metal-dependent hydrolase (beta-lactamase superfamily II)